MSTTQDNAISYFTQGFNCAQAVLLAHGPRLGIEANHCLKLVTGSAIGLDGEVLAARPPTSSTTSTSS
jgi:hypothetical protein